MSFLSTKGSLLSLVLHNKVISYLGPLYLYWFTQCPKRRKDWHTLHHTCTHVNKTHTFTGSVILYRVCRKPKHFMVNSTLFFEIRKTKKKIASENWFFNTISTALRTSRSPLFKVLNSHYCFLKGTFLSFFLFHTK